MLSIKLKSQLSVDLICRKGTGPSGWWATNIPGAICGDGASAPPPHNTWLNVDDYRRERLQMMRSTSSPRICVPPALSRSWPDAVPRVLRAGLGRDAERYAGRRLPGTGLHRPHASDHAALMIEFPGL